MGKEKHSKYAPLKPRFALELAAPHTWPASILPVLFSVALAAVYTGSVSLTLSLSLLAISILMQAAANTLNDYFDYVKGADHIENQPDPTDAVLVYHKVNPRSVLFLAIGFVVVALIIGIYVIICAGWIPLAIGIIGALVIVAYSAGKTPLSYLPAGELASGFAFGGLIPLASYQVLTASFDLKVLYLSIPLILGIALIMFTNNTCDIEKDIEAGRKTIPVLLGRDASRKLYRVSLIVWILSIVGLLAIFFTVGTFIMIFMLLILYPSIKLLMENPLTLQTRIAAMLGCLNLNIGLGVFYTLGIVFSFLANMVV